MAVRHRDCAAPHAGVHPRDAGELAARALLLVSGPRSADRAGHRGRGLDERSGEDSDVQETAFWSAHEERRPEVNAAEAEPGRQTQ
jgi:hypothetical protein